MTVMFTPEEPVEEPIAGVIGVPSVVSDEDSQTARATTDSDFTVAFVDDPATPIAGAIVPKTPDEADFVDDDPNSTRRLTESDFTVAFTPEEPQAPSIQAPSRQTTPTDLTLDSAEFAAAKEEAPDAPRPATDSDYTFAFVEGDASNEHDPLATHGIGATLNADELPAEEVERLTGMWEKTIPPHAAPGMTIKGESPGSASHTHLVVRPRTVRAPAELAPDGADYELLDTIGKGGTGVD